MEPPVFPVAPSISSHAYSATFSRFIYSALCVRTVARRSKNEKRLGRKTVETRNYFVQREKVAHHADRARAQLHNRTILKRFFLFFSFFSFFYFFSASFPF